MADIKAPAQRITRFTEDESHAVAVYLSGSGQTWQRLSHDLVMEHIAEVRAHASVDPGDALALAGGPRQPLPKSAAPPRPKPETPVPGPRFTPRPKATTAAPKEPKPAAPSAEPSSGWTRPAGGW